MVDYKGPLLEWFQDRTPFKDEHGRERIMGVQEKIKIVRFLLKAGSYPDRAVRDVEEALSSSEAGLQLRKPIP